MTTQKPQKDYEGRKGAQKPRTADVSDSPELPGYVFKEVAKKCPWRDVKEDNWCMITQTHSGMCCGKCEESNCGLFYMLGLFNQLNT